MSQKNQKLVAGVDKEVDFVAERADQRLSVQVALPLATPDILEREFSPLEKIPDNDPKLVVSLDEFLSIDRGGIRHVYLLDFLRNP